MTDFVDFDDCDECDIAPTVEKKSLYDMGTHEYEYDSTTLKHYKAIREHKFNVFLPESSDFDPDTAFAYHNMWNPYNGTISGKDPYGPLLFFPDDLIRYFYIRRLDMLWVEPQDDVALGYYQGYYGDAVGAGVNISVAGRRDYPEKYLFRLPITNCYLPTNHHFSSVTMGPMLTDDQIAEIDKLASMHDSYYLTAFCTKRPSLKAIKCAYDQAISKTPDISHFTKTMTKEEVKNMSKETLQDYYNKANRRAVDLLKKL